MTARRPRHAATAVLLALGLVLPGAALTQQPAQSGDDPSPRGGAASADRMLTDSEFRDLRQAVQGCWNVAAASVETMAATVTVLVVLGPDGRPQSVTLIEASGNPAGTRAAFDAARRAVLRCGQGGYPLPPGKYDIWRELQIVFDPTGMVNR